MTKIEKDIKDFSEKGDFLSTMRHAQEMLPITDTMNKLTERPAMYLEFLAGAFLQETGLKPSEAELVQEVSFDKVRWYFRKREVA